MSAVRKVLRSVIPDARQEITPFSTADDVRATRNALRSAQAAVPIRREELDLATREHAAAQALVDAAEHAATAAIAATRDAEDALSFQTAQRRRAEADASELAATNARTRLPALTQRLGEARDALRLAEQAAERAVIDVLNATVAADLDRLAAAREDFLDAFERVRGLRCLFKAGAAHRWSAFGAPTSGATLAGQLDSATVFPSAGDFRNWETSAEPWAALAIRLQNGETGATLES